MKKEIRVAIIGAPSTGKTALAMSLMRNLGVGPIVHYVNKEHSSEHLEYLGQRAGDLLKDKTIHIEEISLQKYDTKYSNNAITQALNMPNINIPATVAMGQVIYEPVSAVAGEVVYAPAKLTKLEKKLTHALEEVKEFLMHIEGRVGSAAFDNIDGIVDAALKKSRNKK